ncbi:MAG: alanine--tRNA ligase [Ruminococcus sp.]|jgi:alanyl-tRNA synthetase|nr:alanine--tRNA ligase [Ruminococcus sp.]
MKSTGLNELRESFLSFFESKGHTRLPSAPLIPQGDNSLLLINSGMAPLKKYFLGTVTPPNVRVTTCQKCIRTPDIERVGKTSRHGTYFEMLGNFSFGDYFKTDAIKWAWEYFTEVLKMPPELLHISVYEQDDEAYDIWTKTIGIDPSHMVRLGKEDNFWEHGEGPCGPCSEIYFDRGPEKGCGSPDCKVGCDCDRFVEVWNLVFSQFDSDGKGNYAEMKSKNIDTGMGLERLACVMQGVDNLFEVDTVQSIMKHICKIAGVQYKQNDKTDISLRVMTDHIRSTVFMVGDGVIPSNEGRGYVLRRLLRRAARHAKLIGIDRLFLSEIADTVIAENAGAYPELAEKQSYIKKIIYIEEEKFAETISRGLELLGEMIKSAKGGVLSGDDAFKLSDTYGFPLDLTIEISGEAGLTVDEARFRELAKIQAETARADRREKSNSSWDEGGIKLDLPKTEFVGYETLTLEAAVLYAENGIVVLDKTPFYAESGGQAADVGTIGDFEVTDVQKDADGHILHFVTGDIKVGETLLCTVSKRHRETMKNHTTAHLLQYALREVLGDHVHQAGQLVNDEFCRFDFTHFSALTKEELGKIETLVNAYIDSATPVITDVMPIAEAKKSGATALFSEKYGDTVRVVSVCGGDLINSKEFCGGTHTGNTAQIGGFKIIAENSVASGVRRITAITGAAYREMFDKNYAILQDITAKVKIQTADEIDVALDRLREEIKKRDRIIAAFEEKSAGSKVDDLLKSATVKDGIKLVTAKFDGMDFETLRKLGDSIKSHTDVAALITNGEKLVSVCGKDAVAAGFKAGDIVKTAAAITGGKGGGKPDSATAGVGDSSKLAEALTSFTG